MCRDRSKRLQAYMMVFKLSIAVCQNETNSSILSVLYLNTNEKIITNIQYLPLNPTHWTFFKKRKD